MPDRPLTLTGDGTYPLPDGLTAIPTAVLLALLEIRERDSDGAAAQHVYNIVDNWWDTEGSTKYGDPEFGWFDYPAEPAGLHLLDGTVGAVPHG